MSKIHVQATPTVFSFSGSLAANASTSGSLHSQGYATLVGGLFTSDSTIAACGLRIDQSFDGGQTWDITNASNAVSSNASAACSVAIIGNAVRIQLQIGATGASAVRARFYLKPI
jgi:hypothetical protein